MAFEGMILVVRVNDVEWVDVWSRENQIFGPNRASCGAALRQRASPPVRPARRKSGLMSVLIMAKVLIPIPHRDFDPSEAAVGWSVLKRLNHSVAFATPDGKPGQADDLMLTGEGLDIWGFIPGVRHLVAVGRLMRANADARRAYAAMEKDPAFTTPLTWRRCAAAGFRRPSSSRRAPRARHARLSGKRNPAAPGGGILCRRCAGRGDLPRRAARSAQPRGRRPLGALRTPHDGADLELRAQGRDGRPRRALLGPELLPNLSGRARRAARLYVGSSRKSRARWRSRRIFSTCRRTRPTTGARPTGFHATRSTTTARPSWCATAVMYRRVGPAMRYTFAKTFAAVLAERARA